MSDDLTPSQQAAAFHGLAINRSTPPSERLECALTALNLYETVTEKLRAERDALLAAYDATREGLCSLCASGICSAHQPGVGIIDALQSTEGAQP